MNHFMERVIAMKLNLCRTKQFGATQICWRLLTILAGHLPSRIAESVDLRRSALAANFLPVGCKVNPPETDSAGRHHA